MCISFGCVFVAVAPFLWRHSGVCFEKTGKIVDRIEMQRRGDLRKGDGGIVDEILGERELFFVDVGDERFSRFRLEFPTERCTIGVEQKRQLVDRDLFQIVIVHVGDDLTDGGGMRREGCFLAVQARCVLAHQRDHKMLQKNPQKLLCAKHFGNFRKHAASFIYVKGFRIHVKQHKYFYNQTRFRLCY